MEPLVSIITPSYNQGRFIRDTIESVLSQDYPNIQYIVVDGGSTDETLSILNEYKDKISFISEKDEGQSDAINKGFKMAKGGIVAWLNSDDIYEPGCISKAVNALNKNPNVALVYGEGYIIDAEGRKLKSFEYTQNFNLWSLIHIWDYIMQPTTFFRAEALKNVGYLNKELYWTMDWELWLKLALKYDVLYIPEFMACSREYEETKTSTGGEKRLQEILGLMQKFSDEKNPYGYEIYYCAELLASVSLTEQRRKEVEDRLTYLLTFQPVPNKENRCLSQIYFEVRPGALSKEIVIESEQNRSVDIEIFVDGKSLYRKKNVGKGKYNIPLYFRNRKCQHTIMVKLNSLELLELKSSYESWIKVYFNDVLESSTFIKSSMFKLRCYLKRI